VLGAMAGPDPRDPTTDGEFHYRERGAVVGGAGRRFRIGVVKDATARAEPEVAQSFRRALDVLRTFATLDDDVAFPDFPYVPAVRTIVSAEGAAAFRDLIETGGVRALRDKADRVNGYAMLMTPAVDYLQALRLRTPIRAALDELLSRYDALVAPTRGGTAPSIGYDFDQPKDPQPEPPADAPRAPALIPAGNLAGLPALAVPMGFGRKGLPTSLQFLGRAFSESTLVALADRYQQDTDWHTRRPPAV
jgi:aspartyl-tRNA(Asn)/glutamyl-tRNA(Gln) amidotransferase subunit A